MNDNLQRAPGYVLDADQPSLGVRNRVLRNTYWLLALSLLPTIGGAWYGVVSGIAHSPGILLVLVLASFGLMFGIYALRNSAAGVAVLLGFTFVMGLMLSNLLSFTLRLANGPELIMLAFGGTAGVFFAMATVATVSKRDFSGLGQWLFAGLIVIVVAGLVSLFVHTTALSLAISVVAIFVFSGLMLYDVQRVVRGGETNYITATLAIYLDIINLFQNLLFLLSIFSGNSRN